MLTQELGEAEGALNFPGPPPISLQLTLHPHCSYLGPFQGPGPAQAPSPPRPTSRARGSRQAPKEGARCGNNPVVGE